jgi:hypothetical protein
VTTISLHAAARSDGAAQRDARERTEQMSFDFHALPDCALNPEDDARFRDRQVVALCAVLTPVGRVFQSGLFWTVAFGGDLIELCLDPARFSKECLRPLMDAVGPEDGDRRVGAKLHGFWWRNRKGIPMLEVAMIEYRDARGIAVTIGSLPSLSRN